MITKRLLRFLCMLLALIQAIWFFLPYIDYRWMTNDQLMILSYGAFGASVEFSLLTYWLYMLLFFASLLAVYLLGRRARYYFAGVVVSGVLLFVGYGGMVIEVGYSMVLRDFSNILIGGVIVLSFTQTESDA